MRKSWAKHGSHVFIAATCGAIVSVAMFAITRQLERSRAEKQFVQVADQRLSSVRTHVAGALNTVRLLASHLESTGHEGASRQGFSLFVQPALANQPYLQALEWIPRVRQAERAGYESAARADGMTGFQFTEPADGAMKEAGQRDEYFPVFYVEPLAGNERAVGYDLASNPVRRAALLQSRDSGKVVATPRIKLIQEKDNQYGTLVFSPVYDRSRLENVLERQKALRGFALGVLRIGDFVATTDDIQRRLDSTGLVDIHLFDLTTMPLPQQLYPAWPDTKAETLVNGLHAQETFNVGGRNWLLLATPGPGFSRRSSLAPFLVLGCGLLVTGMYLRYLLRRIRTDSEQLELEAQLRQAQKLEALGALTGGITHDFNNLLTIINSYCFLTLNQVDTPGPVRFNVEQILAAGNRAASLTRQLLAFSRKQVLSPAVLNLGSVVSGLKPLLKRLIGEDISLELQAQQELWLTKADPSQIEQVIFNLAVNARDAMPHGGKLRMETANVELDEAFVREHPRSGIGQYVVLTVSDTGRGISPEIQQRIFDPFFTTKEAGKGTGLGLSTVYGIVRQSGGYVAVESKIGKGTTFRVYLPRTTEPAASAQVKKVAGLAQEPKTTVLLAEDEDATRTAIAEYLACNGFQVIAASNADEALRASESRYPGAIDILLTDAIMPGMNAKELVTRLRKRLPDIKVVLMSGHADEVLAARGLLQPQITFIAKPFAFQDLADKLRGALAERGGAAAGAFSDN
jgi:signal transduction histidine kinase/ActR/RegA family two-component response regulator